MVILKLGPEDNYFLSGINNHHGSGVEESRATWDVSYLQNPELPCIAEYFAYKRLQWICGNALFNSVRDVILN